MVKTPAIKADKHCQRVIKTKKIGFPWNPIMAKSIILYVRLSIPPFPLGFRLNSPE